MPCWIQRRALKTKGVTAPKSLVTPLLTLAHPTLVCGCECFACAQFAARRCLCAVLPSLAVVIRLRARCFDSPAAQLLTLNPEALGAGSRKAEASD
jgi:hypothetical protein